MNADVEHGCMVSCAGLVSLVDLGLEDGDVSTFKLLLYMSCHQDERRKAKVGHRFAYSY